MQRFISTFFSKAIPSIIPNISLFSPELTYLEKIQEKYRGKTFDLGIIGGSKVSLVLAYEASKLGLKVAFIADNLKELKGKSAHEFGHLFIDFRKKNNDFEVFKKVFRKK